MEYTKRARYTINTEANDLADIYQHDLQMYNFPPIGEIPFIEFQQLGIDRLKLLQHVESNGVRTDVKSIHDRRSNLDTLLMKDGLKYFSRLLKPNGYNKPSGEPDLRSRRKDHVSHFIMRLSYCKEPDRQMWFINQEIDLFKLRFSSLDKENIENLLSLHKIDCKQITKEEKEEIREELGWSTAKDSNIETSDFYKVSYQRVTDLIKSRRVYLRKGMAYIPHDDLVSLFVSYFREILIDGMEYAKNYLSNVSDDERLMSFLKSLPGSFSGMTRVVWTTATTPIDKLDELSKSSYPLCMRTLHEALKTDHHLRNSGRIQYGLFLKGIGVTLEDALRFWKTEFTKKIDPDKFDKQHTYGIKHMFGKEGKQTNYTPLGCPKIITAAVGTGEYHGCPYRHMDQESLKQKLFAHGLHSSNVIEIGRLAREGHYLVACSEYFKSLHNRPPEKPFMHPNRYFNESRDILAKDQLGGGGGGGTGSEGNNEKFSQTGRFSETRGSATPSRRVDDKFKLTAASRRLPVTPTRSIAESTGTPSRNIERNKQQQTPVRNTVNRIGIDSCLNDDQIVGLISDEDN